MTDRTALAHDHSPTDTVRDKSDPATPARLRGKKTISGPKTHRQRSIAIVGPIRSIDRPHRRTEIGGASRPIPERGTVTCAIDRRPPADNSVTTGRAYSVVFHLFFSPNLH